MLTEFRGSGQTLKSITKGTNEKKRKNIEEKESKKILN